MALPHNGPADYDTTGPANCTGCIRCVWYARRFQRAAGRESRCLSRAWRSSRQRDGFLGTKNGGELPQRGIVRSFSLHRFRLPSATCMANRFGRDELKARLRAARPAVLPSLLACDFGHLEREVKAVESAGAPALHLDVMDGHFVPNISFGFPIVKAVRRITKLPLDVHLMISRPADYVERFRDAGADSLSIHVEAVSDPRPLLDKIRSLGALAGLAINPPTPLSAIEADLPHCDIVLVMSVMPGFGGQEFEDVALEKLKALSDRADCDALLEVDGGVSAETAGACAEAGADLYVAGTAVFSEASYATAIERIHSAAAAKKHIQSVGGK
jgi:ribulose-phosphate 3-epimerase